MNADERGSMQEILNRQDARAPGISGIEQLNATFQAPPEAGAAEERTL